MCSDAHGLVDHDDIVILIHDGHVETHRFRLMPFFGDVEFDGLPIQQRARLGDRTIQHAGLAGFDKIRRFGTRDAQHLGNRHVES